jgi:hypothetical protein
MEGKGCCKGQPENSCSTEKTGSCDDKTGGCGPGDTKGKCCPVTLLKGGVAGGIIMFAWFSLSWMVLPWHTKMATPPETAVLAEYFLFCVVAALLLTKILKKRATGCCPVAGGLVVGLLVAIFNYVPNLIWQHTPPQDALVGMADDLIAITLAGAAIGKCVLKAGSCGPKDKDAVGSCGTKTGSCS